VGTRIGISCPRGDSETAGIAAGVSPQRDGSGAGSILNLRRALSFLLRAPE
jgi:hypothetical protein